MKKKDSMLGYRFFKAVLGPIFKLWYNPTIIGKEYIPETGPILIVGNHKHLYEDVGISHGETISPIIKMWGLVYRATNPITGFNYAAKQYYGPDYNGKTDFANRDRSIHKRAQIKWLDPLMTPGNEYHDKFVSSNEKYLKTMYTKMVKDALSIKK